MEKDYNSDFDRHPTSKDVGFHGTIKRKHGDNCLCLKCAHSWFSSKFYLSGTPPATCSRCHRYDWQEPRVRAFTGKKSTKPKQRIWRTKNE